MNPLDAVEGLIARIDAGADAEVRGAAHDLIHALLEFHGTALARILGMLDASVVQSMARDDAIRPLLLLYDLHPESIEVRVRRALDRVRGVESVAVDGLGVKVRLSGLGHPPSRDSVEAIILEAAPEIQAVHIEGLRTPDFVPLANLLAV